MAAPTDRKWGKTRLISSYCTVMHTVDGFASFAQSFARAGPTKGTSVSAFYRGLATRRGKRRAILAVAHSIMFSVFHMLVRNEPSRELGANYFDERRRPYTVDRLPSRIEHLGYRGHLEPLPTVAA